MRWPRGPADEETVSCRACGEPARQLRVGGVMSGDKRSRLRNVDCQGTLRAWLESQTLNWQLCQCQSAQGCETCCCREAPPHSVARLVVAGHMVGPVQEVLIKCLQAPARCWASGGDSGTGLASRRSQCSGAREWVLLSRLGISRVRAERCDGGLLMLGSLP